VADTSFQAQRRSWLLALAASGVFGAAGLTGLIRRVHAAARRPHPEGVQELKGEVRINKTPARPGALVQPGDTVTTGADSHVVFVVGNDAYLLRAHSRLQVNGERAGKTVGGEMRPAVVKVLNLMKGKMLAAFGRGEKQIIAPTVTLGIRGTGVYIEAQEKRAYVCTCYGETVIEARGSNAREEIRATHHDAPRYVYARGGAEAIAKAPVINHGDDELIMLEALLGRTPPFAGSGYERRY
jgi:hypothetical protein